MNGSPGDLLAVGTLIATVTAGPILGYAVSRSYYELITLVVSAESKRQGFFKVGLLIAFAVGFIGPLMISLGSRALDRPYGLLTLIISLEIAYVVTVAATLYPLLSGLSGLHERDKTTGDMYRRIGQLQVTLTLYGAMIVGLSLVEELSKAVVVFLFFWVLLVVVEPLLMDADASPPTDDERQKVAAVTGNDGAFRRVMVFERLPKRDPGGAVVGLPGREDLYLSKGLDEVLSDEAFEALLAHEVGHTTTRQTFFRYLTVPILGIVLLVLLWTFNVTVLELGGLLVLAFLVSRAVGRQLEYRADAYAAAHVDSAAMILALEELSDADMTHNYGRLRRLFVSHPHINDRIERLTRKDGAISRIQGIN